MGLFGRKKEKVAAISGVSPPPPGALPLKEAAALRSSGMNNEQIINQLKAQGYSFSQIRDALAQLDLRSQITSINDLSPIGQAPTAPTSPINTEAPVETITAPTSAAPVSDVGGKKLDVNEIERILEEIIRERWKEVESEMERFNVWRNKTESMVNSLNDKVKDLKTRLDMIQAQTMQKVEEYGKAITDSKIEIQAVEKAMSKLIPALSDNIQQLRNLVEKGKKSK